MKFRIKAEASTIQLIIFKCTTPVIIFLIDHDTWVYPCFNLRQDTLRYVLLPWTMLHPLKLLSHSWPLLS